MSGGVESLRNEWGGEGGRRGGKEGELLEGLYVVWKMAVESLREVEGVVRERGGEGEGKEGEERLEKFMRAGVGELEGGGEVKWRGKELVGGLGKLKSGERVWVKGVGVGGGEKGEEVIKRLVDEAVLLSNIRSNYVPLFFGACFSCTSPFFLMEYVPGYSLYTILEGKGGRGKGGKEGEEVGECVEGLEFWGNRWQVLADILVGLSVLHRFFFFFLFLFIHSDLSLPPSLSLLFLF